MLIRLQGIFFLAGQRLKETGLATSDAAKNPAITIKKYANRRLYNTDTSSYVTLEDLAEMVKIGDDFVVVDAKTSEDITRSVLTQIIFEQEAKGENLLPISFLRQLIRFYGDSMQALIPSYLDYSLSSFVRDQGKFREQMTNSFNAGTFGLVEDQVKRNTEMFEQAVRMFMPFSTGEHGANGSIETSDVSDGNDDLDAMKRRLADMEKKLDRLSKDGA
ncbi:MAG: polyhydroxyalkanoate synthesis repressor PhaR [Pseudomonadota bacterium]